MRCSSVQKLYDEFASSALSAWRTDRIERHLNGCEACRCHFEDNDALGRLICDSAEVVHPGASYLDELTANVMARLDEEPAQVPPRATSAETIWGRISDLGWRPLWAAGGAAAVLVMLPLSLRLFDSESAQTASVQPDPASMISHPGAPSALPAGTFDQPAHQLSMSSGTGVSVTKSALASPAPRMISGDVADRRGQAGFVAVSSMPLIERDRNAVPRASDAGALGQGSTAALEELIALEAVGTPAARDRICTLLRDIGRQRLELTHASVTEKRRSDVLHHAHLYREAASLLRMNETERAIRNFAEIVADAPDTLLARRANLHLGDIYFYELGEFELAESAYSMANQGTARYALTSEETRHVAAQQSLLERFYDENWDSLGLLHEIATATWEGAAEALTLVIDDRANYELLPGAYTTFSERLVRGDMPDEELSFELIDMIENAIATPENPSRRSWLELTRGDLIWLRFESPGPAIDAYLQALQSDSAPKAKAIARARLQYIQAHQAAVFGR